MEREDASGPIYRILGPLEVVNHNKQGLNVTPGRQEIVLSLLLLEANRVVSIDHMIDAIWDDQPPATARTQVQICVSALRNKLSKIGFVDTIVTKPPGYLMHVARGHLDAQVFRTMVAESETAAQRGRVAEASKILRDALALWRGPALTGLTSRMMQAIATQMDERRMSAVESRIDLELQLNRHYPLIGELSELVSEHPLRERLRGQLMLALHRSGRQSEALELYRAGRALLIDQLGLEPGDELRQLEAAILSGDTALAPEQTAVTALPAAESEIVVPFQLPTDIADFSGREELVMQVESQLLDENRQLATRVVVLTGKPGVGKSTLAVHVAHRLLESHFPDGQLYRDLGGTQSRPATAADVLGRFLRAMGIPGATIPETEDERAEMYRHLLARKRMLVVLDDVLTESQVRLLLPGSSSCAVIITSRARLTGLPGAQVLEVGVLDPGQAVRMLASVIGDQRISDQPAAAEALVRLVGGLPLALRIVAARLAARPHWSLAWMLERLSDERRRLDELAHGEMMVRASLAMTYDGLEQGAGRLLRLLSAIDGLSFPGWVAAALLDVDPFRAVDLLELLVDAQLLEISGLDINGSPRYKFHDLIRLFAREQLEQRELPADRHSAVERVIGGWLAIASEAHRRLYGGDFTVLHGDAPRWHPPQSYVDEVLAEPFVWLEAEHANMCSAVALAAEEDLAESCWDLAVTLVTLFEARCYFDDWERTHRQALEAARAAGNRRGQAALMCSLGSLQLSRARPRAAEDLLVPALATFDELGDAHGAAIARRNLALLDQLHGGAQQAAVLYRRALDGFRQTGDSVGQAHVLGQMAQLDLDAGDQDSAGARLHKALEICRETGSRRVEAQLRFRLSDLMMRQERLHDARDVLMDLLDSVRVGHDIVGEGRILHRLGVVNVRLGRVEVAKELFRDAFLAMEQAMDHGRAAEVRLELASLLAELGDRANAAELLDQAMTTFHERNMAASAQRAATMLDSIASV